MRFFALMPAVLIMLASCGSKDDKTGDLVPEATTPVDSQVLDMVQDAQGPDVVETDATDATAEVDSTLRRPEFEVPPQLDRFCTPDTMCAPPKDTTIAYYQPGKTVFVDISGTGGAWQPGDIEATCFDPEHPFVLASIRVYLSMAGPAEIHLWSDFGGSWPDRDNDLVPPFMVESPGEGWLDLEIPAPGLPLEPYQRVWVGLVHDESAMTLAADQGDPFLLDPGTPTWAMTNHSKLWSQWYVEQMKSQGGFQWMSSPYTYLVELVGTTVCKWDSRQFVDVSDQAFPAEIFATRTSFSDIDGDGYDDFMVHNNRYATEPKEQVLRNRGDGTFEDWSEQSGLAGRSSNLVTFADVDNDGDQDALLSVYYNLENNPDPAFEDAMMLNDGSGHFEESPEAGVANGSTTATAAFADYDGDGLLDHFAGNTRHHGEDKNYDQAMKDMLFRGIGAGTFEEVTDAAGMADQPSSYYPLNPEFFTLTNGAIWTDYDGDGDSDLYVANYGLTGNFMWENQGDGTFLEVGVARNLHGDDRDGLFADGTSFGAHWADYDNDGDMDLFQTEISHPRYHPMGSDRSSLRRNPGGKAPVFEIVTELVGVNWDEGDYEASWVDFDNDGLMDLYISSVYGLHYSRLYRQTPDHTFVDWSYVAGVRWPNAKSHAWADVDRDGDQDLLVCSRQPEWSCRLFRNEIGQDNSWLTVSLVGVQDNRDGIGARVEVQIPGWPALVREVRAGGGHTRQDSLPVEFGLGSYIGDVLLKITWPGGLAEVHEGVPVGKFVVATQGNPQLALQ